MDGWQKLLEGEAEEWRLLLREEFEDMSTIQELIHSECAIAQEEDEELSPDELAALEEALAEPTLGPFSTEQLAQMVDTWQAWEGLQATPAYVERFARAAEAPLGLDIEA